VIINHTLLIFGSDQQLSLKLSLCTQEYLNLLVSIVSHTTMVGIMSNSS